MKSAVMMLTIICTFCLSHVYVFASNNGSNARVLSVENKRAGLYDKIKLTLKNLDEFDREARAKKKEIIPYLNGLPLKGVKTRISGKDSLDFLLSISEESKETWRTLVRERENFFSSTVTLSVGLEDADQVPTDVLKFQLIIVKTGWFVLCSVVVIFFLALFIWLARSSNIIRDAGPNPAKKDGMKPFSLGRTQMAIWFFLVWVSYLFLWLLTRELGTITASILGLMGISAGTALGATVIDIGKDNAAAVAQKEKLDSERDELNKRIPELESAVAKSPPPPDLDDLKVDLENKRKRRDEVQNQISRKPASGQVRISKGFFRDLVSDSLGVS